MFLGRGVPVFCLPTVLGQMRRSFPASSVGVRVNQCPLVMAHGCTQKGEWGFHGERLPLRWSSGSWKGSMQAPTWECPWEGSCTLSLQTQQQHPQGMA